MHTLHAPCALSARNARQKPSSSVNVRTPARRKAAESLAFAPGLASPKAEVARSNRTGSANSFKDTRRKLSLKLRPLSADRPQNAARFVATPFAGAAP